jgi:hypothetical protein
VESLARNRNKVLVVLKQSLLIACHLLTLHQLVASPDKLQARVSEIRVCEKPVVSQLELKGVMRRYLLIATGHCDGPIDQS